MKRFHIVVDIDKCVGCFNCMLACKDEHCGNSWLPYTDAQKQGGNKWIDVTKTERGSYPRVGVNFLPSLCNHCGSAPCITARPDVFSRREDGIVLMDPEKAKNRPELVNACPFGAVCYNDEVAAAQKCTGCAHLLDEGWKEPRCVQACPLRALRAVICEDEDFEKLSQVKGLEPLVTEKVAPRVLYKNLHKITAVYIAGSVSKLDGGEENFAKGVKVSLYKDDALLDETLTDAFGDFYFDKLKKNSGEYLVKATLGALSAQCTAELKDGCADIGSLLLNEPH